MATLNHLCMNLVLNKDMASLTEMREIIEDTRETIEALLSLPLSETEIEKKKRIIKQVEENLLIVNAYSSILASKSIS